MHNLRSWPWNCKHFNSFNGNMRIEEETLHILACDTHKHRHFLMLMCITNNDCFFFLLIYFSSAQFLHYFLRSGNIKCISSEQKMQMMRQKNAVTKENRIKKEINKRLQSIIQIDLLMHLVALAREREEEKIKCLNGTIEWTWLFWTKEFLWTSFRSSTFSFVSTRLTSMQKKWEKKTDSSKQLLSESMVVCVFIVVSRVWSLRS